MNKKLAFTTLLLTQAVTPIARPLIATPEIAAHESVRKTMTLTSPQKYALLKQEYELKVSLNTEGYGQVWKGPDIGYEEQIFDFEGHIVLSKPGHEMQVGSSVDGDMVFEKIAQDAAKITYRGYSCSSTQKCYAEDGKDENGFIELYFNRGNNQWSISIRTLVEGQAPFEVTEAVLR